jgi:hypothetical protein
MKRIKIKNQKNKKRIKVILAITIPTVIVGATLGAVLPLTLKNNVLNFKTKGNFQDIYNLSEQIKSANQPIIFNGLKGDFRDYDAYTAGTKLQKIWNAKFIYYASIVYF